MGDGWLSDMQHAIITPGHWKDETVEGVRELDSDIFENVKMNVDTRHAMFSSLGLHDFDRNIKLQLFGLIL